jgi:hypothetical protein
MDDALGMSRSAAEGGGRAAILFHEEGTCAGCLAGTGCRMSLPDGEFSISRTSRGTGSKNARVPRNRLIVNRVPQNAAVPKGFNPLARLGGLVPALV